MAKQGVHRVIPVSFSASYTANSGIDKASRSKPGLSLAFSIGTPCASQAEEHTQQLKQHAFLTTTATDLNPKVQTCICVMEMVINNNSVAQVDASRLHVLLGQLSEQSLSIDSISPQLTGSRA